MKTVDRRARWGIWIIAGVITPLIIVGGLLGTMSSGSNALEQVPVALVNNDELIEEIDDNGEETIIFASRPLVTELVTNDDFAVDWVVTNSAQARDLLAQGDVYAVVEIPEDFSYAVTTLDTDTPRAASFTIITDPSRSYLAGVLGDQIGQALASAVSDEFGKEITSGLFTAIVELGDAFAETAEGAETIAQATEELADGVSELNDGVADLDTATTDLSSGYNTFDDGLSTFASGVTSLSNGLDAFEAETKSLPSVSSGVKDYTDGVASIATGLSALNSGGVFSSITGSTGTTLQALIAGLASLGTSGSTLASGTDTAISGVRTGIVALDTAADTLDEAGVTIDSGSGEIRSGITDLAAGTSDLAEGVDELNDGVGELSEGMREFADGVQEGSAQIQEQGFSEPSDQTVDVLTSPIVFDQTKRSPSVGFQETLSSVFVPLGLWLVALGYFLLLPRPSSRMMTSTMSTRALLGKTLWPVLQVVLAQSLVVTGLLHVVGGVAWSHIPWTLPLVLLSALGSIGVHFAIWAWRPVLLAPLSITALVIQVVSLKTLIPLEILPSVYQALSIFSPVTWSSDAMLAALAGGDPGRVAGALVLLGSLFLASSVLAYISLSRQRIQALRSELGIPPRGLTQA
ncbi:MAG: ABC transporter permease [Microbacteriaceae bacterium]|nr:ABC transporter permease [Microbacteriaceae bacterium]